MSGELRRPIDIASGESGGRLGGFRTGRAGVRRALGRGLGGGDASGDEAPSASARGFARHLGRAVETQYALASEPLAAETLRGFLPVRPIRIRFSRAHSRPPMRLLRHPDESPLGPDLHSAQKASQAHPLFDITPAPGIRSLAEGYSGVGCWVLRVFGLSVCVSRMIVFLTPSTPLFLCLHPCTFHDLCLCIFPSL